MFVRDGAVTPGPSRECDITSFVKGWPKSARQSRDSTVTARRVQSITVPSSRVSRKCHSPGLRSPPPFKNARKKYSLWINYQQTRIYPYPMVWPLLRPWSEIMVSIPLWALKTLEIKGFSALWCTRSLSPFLVFLFLFLSLSLSIYIYIYISLSHSLSLYLFLFVSLSLSLSVSLSLTLCASTYIHTYMHACMHTYICIYIHTYIHTYIYIYIYIGELVSVPPFRPSRVRNSTTSRVRNSTTSWGTIFTLQK